MKERVSVSLSPSIAKGLDRAAEDAKILKSDVVEEALKAWLDPKADETASAVLLRRFEVHAKTLRTLERDLAIVTETLGLFVRYVLTITPPLAAAEQESARLLGQDRFHRFVAQVGRRLASDQRLIVQVLETIAAEKPELFADAIHEAEADGEIDEDSECGEDDHNERKE